MNIVYTKHAKAKFEILERHRVTVTEGQVADTVLNPDRVIAGEGEQRAIAQKRISDRHVLRVNLSTRRGRYSCNNLLSWKESAI